MHLSVLSVTLLSAMAIGEVLNRGDIRGRFPCGNPARWFEDVHVRLAAEEALRLHDTNQVVGDRGYPHHYGNHDRIPIERNCNADALQEFPLWNGGAPYSGAGPDLHRVLVNYVRNDRTGVNDVRVCGVMAHPTNGNGFRSCAWRRQ